MSDSGNFLKKLLIAIGKKEKSQEKAIVYMDMNWQPDIHEMFKPFGSILYSKLAMLWV